MIENESFLMKLYETKGSLCLHSFRSASSSTSMQLYARMAAVYFSIAAIMWTVMGSLPRNSYAAPQLQRIASDTKVPPAPIVTGMSPGTSKEFDPVPFESLNSITKQLLLSRFPENDYGTVKRATRGLKLPSEEDILAAGVDVIQVDGRYCHNGFCLTLVLDLTRNVIAAEFLASPKHVSSIITLCVSGELIYPHRSGPLDPILVKGNLYSRRDLSPVLVCTSETGPRVLVGEGVMRDALRE